MPERRALRNALSLWLALASAGEAAGGQNEPGTVRQSAAAPSDTAPAPFLLGERLRFFSRRLGATREVIVTTPASYATGSRRYPVLYVLDGAENAAIATVASRQLAAAGRIPEMIVVSIVNGDREVDFTPPLRRTRDLPPGIEHAGGVNAFLAYVGDELIPFIDSRLRTRPLRTIVGHSLGGLAAVHALAARPELFRRYVTVDPSLWWDAGAEVDAVHAALSARPSAIARVAAVRTDSASLARMSADAPRDVSTIVVPVLGEAHEFLMYKGLYDGLIALFADYIPAMRHDMSAATVAALREQYSQLSRTFGYDVPVPLNNLLEVADREGNQRRFANARAALHMADSLYPGARSIVQFRTAIEQNAAEAAREGKTEIVSTLSFTPTTREVATRLLGNWRGRSYSLDPSFHPTTSSAVFELRGDTLLLRGETYGVALDGGVLRGLYAE